MAQQTAIEWLNSELKWHIKICNTEYVQQEEIHIPMWMYNKLLEQAKQMYKEQIMNARLSTFDLIRRDDVLKAEQYYNETYGENKD